MFFWNANFHTFQTLKQRAGDFVPPFCWRTVQLWYCRIEQELSGFSNVKENTQWSYKLSLITGDLYEKMFRSLTTSPDKMFSLWPPPPPNPMFEASVVRVIVASHDMPFKGFFLFNNHFKCSTRRGVKGIRFSKVLDEG